MRVYRLFSFLLLIPLHVILHASNLSFVSHPHKHTYSLTHILLLNTISPKIIISFFHHKCVSCYIVMQLLIYHFHNNKEFSIFQKNEYRKWFTIESFVFIRNVFVIILLESLQSQFSKLITSCKYIQVILLIQRVLSIMPLMPNDLH